MLLFDSLDEWSLSYLLKDTLTEQMAFSRIEPVTFWVVLNDLSDQFLSNQKATMLLALLLHIDNCLNRE